MSALPRRVAAQRADKGVVHTVVRRARGASTSACWNSAAAPVILVPRPLHPWLRRMIDGAHVPVLTLWFLAERLSLRGRRGAGCEDC